MKGKTKCISFAEFYKRGQVIKIFFLRWHFTKFIKFTQNAVIFFNGGADLLPPQITHTQVFAVEGRN